MSETESKYTSIEDSYKVYFKNEIYQEFGNSASIVLDSFDYNNKKLKIRFRYSSSSDYKEIVFEKKDGDLYISESKSCWANKVFNAICTELSRLYDEFMKYSAYKKEYCYEINPVNSNFIVDITKNGIKLYNQSSTSKYTYDFEVNFQTFNNKYNYHCNSSTVISTFKDNEDEIFKRIFVKISDCPKWSQSILYERRQKQLAKEQKIEKERNYKEIKKQKKLELTRKILPFLKK